MMTSAVKQETEGVISQILGGVVDVAFPPGPICRKFTTRSVYPVTGRRI